MAALTGNRLVKTKQMDPVQGGIVLNYAVVASDIIYQGALLEVAASGYVQPAGVGSGLQFAGLALEKADNSSGSAGDVTCKTLVGGFIEHDVASTTIANIGDPVYASDDQTLTLVSTGNALVGWIVQFISGDTCIVKCKYPGQPLT